MRLNWQGPAIDAVESGGSEPLWKWVQKEVAAGRSYDDIGEDLGIAGKTVEAGFYRYAGRPEEKSTVSHRPVLGRGSAPAVPTVLANLGFKPVERQLLSNRGKLGMFLSVQCSKGVPMRLTLSQELNRISGIEVGEALDAYENGDGQVAFAVGEGPLTVTRQGSSLGFTCPLLLEKLGIKPGQRLVAAYKDGFFIVDVRAETGG